MAHRYEVKAEQRAGVDVFSLRECDVAEVEIAPALGNNCFSFRKDEPILGPVSFADFLKRPTSYGIPLLFPFPNRIRDGAFMFRGERFAIDMRLVSAYESCRAFTRATLAH